MIKDLFYLWNLAFTVFAKVEAFTVLTSSARTSEPFMLHFLKGLKRSMLNKKIHEHFTQIFLNPHANYQLLFVKNFPEDFQSQLLTCHLSKALAQGSHCFHQGTASFEQVPDKVSDLWKLSSASVGHCRLKSCGDWVICFHLQRCRGFEFKNGTFSSCAKCKQLNIHFPSSDFTSSKEFLWILSVLYFLLIGSVSCFSCKAITMQAPIWTGNE